MGGGVALLGILAGWSIPVVAVAALLALALGAVLGQMLWWVRVTTGRLARLEHFVNHRLEGLKNDTSRRDDAMGKNIVEIRGKVGKIDNELTFPRSTYRLALRELAQGQSAERRENRVQYQQKLDDQVALLESFMQLQRLVPMIFKGSGDCTKVDWTFLGGSIANWSFVAFVSIALLMLAIRWRDGWFKFSPSNPNPSTD